MSKLVVVTGLDLSHRFKREALLFDQINVVLPPGISPEIYLTSARSMGVLGFRGESFANDVEWLNAEGIIEYADIGSLSQYIGKLAPDDRKSIDAFAQKIDLSWFTELTAISKFSEHMSELGKDVYKVGKEKLDELKRLGLAYAGDVVMNSPRVTHLVARLYAMVLQSALSPHVFPLIPTFFQSDTQTDPESVRDLGVKKSDVLHLVLNHLPTPDDSVSWEQILDFRSDPDSKTKYWALRNWIGEMARAELSPYEIEEKLEHLIHEYEQHIRLHRMKYNAGTLELVVTMIPEFLEDLIKFKWKETAQLLFRLQKRRLNLMETELKAPGREIAYLFKAKESFTTA